MKIDPTRYGFNKGLFPCKSINGEISINLPIGSLKNTISLIQSRKTYSEQNFGAISGGALIGFVISLVIGFTFFKTTDSALAISLVGLMIGAFVIQQKRSTAQEKIDYQIAQSISLTSESEDLIKARSKLIFYDWSKFCSFFDDVRNQIDGLEEIGVKWWLSRTSYELENAVANMFKRRGFKSTVTPGSGDGGIDVIVENFENQNLYIQCKGWNNKAGPQIVRELVGSLNVIDDTKAQGIVFCSKGFTQGAIDYANQSHIILWIPENLSTIAEKYEIVQPK
jgi:HJR/Mrr/RecB family endonuclease